MRLHRHKISQAQRRHCSTIDKAIAKFLSKIEIGADFVCTSCHRLLFCNSVVTCNRAKYTKCTEELLDSVRVLTILAMTGMCGFVRLVILH